MSDNFITSQQSVLTYVKNERTSGYIPKYEQQSKTTESSGLYAQSGMINSEQLLNAAPQNSTNKDNEHFGFADLVDMVNPLHHVPVLGYAYREITGDEIKPIGKIVGGAAFGGPIGAASALIDTVIAEETGNDIAGNAFNLAFNDQPKAQSFAPSQSNNPETALENAIQSIEDYDMTAALLSYSDLGHKSDAMLKYEASESVKENMSAPRQREPITEVSFSNQKGGLYNLDHN